MPIPKQPFSAYSFFLIVCMQPYNIGASAITVPDLQRKTASKHILLTSNLEASNLWPNYGRNVYYIQLLLYTKAAAGKSTHVDSYRLSLSLSLSPSSFPIHPITATAGMREDGKKNSSSRQTYYYYTFELSKQTTTPLAVELLG